LAPSKVGVVFFGRAPNVDPPGAGGAGRISAPHRGTSFRHPILWVAGRRLALSAPLLLVVSALSFILLALTPGDAARAIVGLTTPEEHARLRRELGLDQPLYAQYWHWLSHALRGDLGSSIVPGGGHVAPQLVTRMPVTISLMAGALVLSIVIGVIFGVISAVRGGVIDRVVATISMAGWILPSFWVGAELIVLFAVKVRWFPATGFVPLSQSPTGWLRSVALPSFALSLGGIGALAKQTRSAMLDSLSSEHVRMLHASGVRPHSIILRHALKNAAPTVVTMIGLMTIGLLSGTVFAEYVFALPGLGSLLIGAVNTHDLPVVQGIVVFFTLAVVVISLLVDLSYAWLNPKLRVQ
jgi:peptide/nickel transport system permease protein